MKKSDLEYIIDTLYSINGAVYMSSEGAIMQIANLIHYTEDLLEAEYGQEND